MAIKSMQEKFIFELSGLYDAENQFLKGQQEMLQNASNPNLQRMIQQHIQQTEQQISNLDSVFSLLGQQAKSLPCDGARGIVQEGQKLMKETAGSAQILDCAIAGAAGKVEHYEIATYRGLILGAQMMGQQEIVNLLQQNLQQEESTAALIESSAPQLIQTAMQSEDLTGLGMNQSNQSYSTNS